VVGAHGIDKPRGRQLLWRHDSLGDAACQPEPRPARTDPTRPDGDSDRFVSICMIILASPLSRVVVVDYRSMRKGRRGSCGEGFLAVAAGRWLGWDSCLRPGCCIPYTLILLIPCHKQNRLRLYNYSCLGSGRRPTFSSIPWFRPPGGTISPSEFLDGAGCLGRDSGHAGPQKTESRHCGCSLAQNL